MLCVRIDFVIETSLIHVEVYEFLNLVVAVCSR